MDREKVIKGLEHCKKYGALGGNDCNGHYEYTDNLQDIIKANDHRKDCLYGQCKTGCVVTLIDDALALLKEQEAVVHPEPSCEMTYITDCCCDLCGVQLIREDNFCRCCGKRIEWEGR